MGIDYSGLRSLTARRVISALLEDGFYLRATSGSHRRFRHPDGRMVTISFHHASDTFPIKTLRTIIEVQAGWREEDLVRLGLLR